MKDNMPTSFSCKNKKRMPVVDPEGISNVYSHVSRALKALEVLEIET